MTASLPWFRIYDEALDDPKVQRLSDALFRHWFNLLCLANRGNPRGRLPEKLEDIAYSLRLTPRKTRQVLDELTARGLLVLEQSTSRVMPNRWDERQKKSDSSAERVARHRDKQEARNVTQPLQKRNSNALDIEKETDTEKSREDIAPQPPRGPRPKRATQIDPAWEPDEVLLAWAQTKHISQTDIDAETERFKNHYLAKGEARADWNASFRNWMTSPLRSQPARASPAQVGPRRATAHDFFEMAGLTKQEQR